MDTMDSVATIRENSLGQEQRTVFANLDIIRGVAAIAVVLWHAEALFGFRPNSGYLAVDLFFVLSGVVIAKSYDQRIANGMSVREFSLLRLIRLYPAYLLALCLSFGAVLAAATFGFSTNWKIENLLPAFLFSIAFIPVFGRLSSNGTIFPLNTPSWSLFFELLVNFMFISFHPFLKGRLSLVALASCMIWLIVTVAVFGDLNHGFKTEDWWVGVPRVGYSFGMGVAIERLRRKGSIRKKIHCLVSSGMVLLILCAPIALLIGRPVFDLASVLIAFPTIVALSLHETRDTSALTNFLGNLSYPVYVLHTPILAVFTGLIARTNGHWYASPIFSGIIFIIIATLFSLLITSLVDLPVRRLLAKYARMRNLI